MVIIHETIIVKIIFMATFNDIHDVLINRCGLSLNFYQKVGTYGNVLSKVVVAFTDLFQRESITNEVQAQSQTREHLNNKIFSQGMQSPSPYKVGGNACDQQGIKYLLLCELWWHYYQGWNLRYVSSLSCGNGW